MSSFINSLIEVENQFKKESAEKYGINTTHEKQEMSEANVEQKKIEEEEKKIDEQQKPTVEEVKVEENAEEQAKKVKENRKRARPEDFVQKKVVKKENISDDESDFSDDFIAKKKVKKAKKEKATKPKKIPKKEPKKEPKKIPKKEPKKEPNETKKKPTKTEETWKWWEEKPLPEGVKWMTLAHNGPFFPPKYEKVPEHVHFLYDKQRVRLSEYTEEVASFYAKMLDHEYTKKKLFNDNFFADWRSIMTREEKALIKKLALCDFTNMFNYFKEQHELRKNMSKEDKLRIKEENEKITQHYGFCLMDGHRQKVGNFRIEPPGLFRGRGEHPKQGKLKKRVFPNEITINIGADAPVPTPVHFSDDKARNQWKEVQHDNTVSWLACWKENISGGLKYVMLNPTAKLKGQKDMIKYDVARQLDKHIKQIRQNYKEDLKSKDMTIRQRAVTLYFIDRLALRAGHDKDEGETADTVGCCSLRVEHIKLHNELNGKEYVVEFDFLGKDSIRYVNEVVVDRQVYKNLKMFIKGKNKEDELFDKIKPAYLNKYLGQLMENLTAKVFRTYNASKTLQEQLNNLTDGSSTVQEKCLAYNRANRAVAILCNHQRAVPKSFSQTMENLNVKLHEKNKKVSELEQDLRKAKKLSKKGETAAAEVAKVEKKLEKEKAQVLKLELSMTDKEENKDIALGTSKLNYLDPRITVAWCKKFNVGLEKVYTKTHREKFQWAIDMTDEAFQF